MARFDVLRFDGRVDYVLDVQSDLLSHLETRVVVPLLPVDPAHASKGMTRLNPRIEIVDDIYSLSVPELSAVPVSRLGERVANLEDQRHMIIDALDFLFQGF